MIYVQGLHAYVHIHAEHSLYNLTHCLKRAVLTGSAMLSYETTYPHVKSNVAVLKGTKSVGSGFRNLQILNECDRKPNIIICHKDSWYFTAIGSIRKNIYNIHNMSNYNNTYIKGGIKR